MNALATLSELLSTLPGIGPRQAKRLAHALLRRDEKFLNSLKEAVGSLRSAMTTCAECGRVVAHEDVRKSQCGICRDQNRDNKTLMIVGRDIDLDAIEKSGTYNGRYFVLGGTISILEKKPEEKVRIKKLSTLLAKKDFAEVVIAMNATPDGDATADYLREYLAESSGKKFILSTLGRGLSTGTELEYSDPDTIGNALRGRKKI